MRLIRNLIVLILVLASTAYIAWLFGIFNLLLLVPWDTALVRPEIGTWQRTLNDFFENSTGEAIIYMMSIVLFFVPSIQTLRRRRDAGLRIIIANFLMVFGLIVFFTPVTWINNLIFPVQTGELDLSNPFYVGYRRSIIPVIFMWITYAVWFREIKSLSKHPEKQKNKSKNQDYDSALDRLSDVTMQTDATDYQPTVATSQQITTQ